MKERKTVITDEAIIKVCKELMPNANQIYKACGRKGARDRYTKIACVLQALCSSLCELTNDCAPQEKEKQMRRVALRAWRRRTNNPVALIEARMASVENRVKKLEERADGGLDISPLARLAGKQP